MNISNIRNIMNISFVKSLRFHPNPFIVIFNSFNTKPNLLDQNIEKTINVAIIGVPNAGKSTLINSLVDRQVCPASRKVHTTMNLSKAICNHENTQIVFLDTPGIVNEKEQKRYGLEESVKLSKTSLKNADIVGVIHDASNPYTRDSLPRPILQVLKKNESIPSFLILNKIDLLRSKRKLLDIIRLLSNNTMAGKPIDKERKISEATMGRGFEGFSDVFMISALESDGIDDIMNYIVKNAKPNKWSYLESDWSDKKPEELIKEAVRAKLLDFLRQEIPYKLSIELEHYEDKGDMVVSVVIVRCSTPRILRLILGAGGGRLSKISDSCRYDLVKMFKKAVSLTITLQVQENPLIQL